MTDHSNDLWDNYAQHYDALNRLIPYQEMYSDIISILRRHHANTILDAGCGTGNLLQHCKFHKFTQAKFTCIDASQNMLDIAQDKNSCFLSADFALHNLNDNLPYEDSSFDTVVSVNVLYALKHRLRILREFLRVLRPGGILIVSDPKKDNHPGLILKAHCSSTKSDSFWKFDFSDDALINQRAHEAFGKDVDFFNGIIASNISIEKTASFSYLSAKQWHSMYARAGFTHCTRTTTYAHQNHLFTCST